MESVTYRVNNFHAISIISISVCVDAFQILLSFIPVAGWMLAAVLGVITKGIFILWFLILGVGFADKMNKVAINTVVGFFEFLPLSSAVPMLSVGNVLIIIHSRNTDREKHEKKSMPPKTKTDSQAANDSPRRDNHLAA